jgi:Zn finger protein HypA/HybF involved in hydrogenase expression
MTQPDPHPSPAPSDRFHAKRPHRPRLVVSCDRCGEEMYEHNCKLICPNCGNRFDCSDLNIHFD